MKFNKKRIKNIVVLAAMELGLLVTAGMMVYSVWAFKTYRDESNAASLVWNIAAYVTVALMLIGGIRKRANPEAAQEAKLRDSDERGQRIADKAAVATINAVRMISIFCVFVFLLTKQSALALAFVIIAYGLPVVQWLFKRYYNKKL
jgi:hypothetical protein